MRKGPAPSRNDMGGRIEREDAMSRVGRFYGRGTDEEGNERRK